MQDSITLYWEDEGGDEAGGGYIEVPLASRRRVDWFNVEKIMEGPVQIFVSDQDAVSPPCEPYGLTRTESGGRHWVSVDLSILRFNG